MSMIIIFCLGAVSLAALYFLTFSTFASISYFKSAFKDSGEFNMEKIPYAFFQEATYNLLQEMRSPKARLLSKYRKETRVDKIDTLVHVYFRILLCKDESYIASRRNEVIMIEKYNLQNAVIS